MADRDELERRVKELEELVKRLQEEITDLIKSRYYVK